MDDALTLTYLFAALPAAHERNLESKLIHKAKNIVAAWGAYCATTSAVTKSFISVKGIYMEAEIHNCTTPVRWIIPHAFTQFLPDDVDFRVMNTFFEFYETLLNFILYKLYNDIGVRYPFTAKDLGSDFIGSTNALLGANLRALTNSLNPSNEAAIGTIVSEAVRSNIESTTITPKTKADKKKSKELVQSVAAALQTLKNDDMSNDDDDDEMDDDVDISGPLHAALESAAQEEAQSLMIGSSKGSAAAVVDDDVLKRKRLFAGLTFFMSREVPRGYVELVGLAFGAKVGWEGNDSPITMNDPSITHHIVDRPNLPSTYATTVPKSREYVQPQWILDCANFLFLLPISRYAVGMTLPPHLSPWVNDEEEGYKPKYAEEVERLKNGESVDFDDTAAENDTASNSNDINEAIELVEEYVDNDDDKVTDEVIDDESEDSDDDSTKAKEKIEKKRKLEEEEAHRLAKTMMSRKASHLYGRMQHGIAKKKAKIESLNQRRKELIVDPKDNGKERDGLGRLIITGKEKDKTGKTSNKLKVERLKDERKSLEDTYDKTGGSMKRVKKSRT
jgi:pescadillo